MNEDTIKTRFVGKKLLVETEDGEEEYDTQFLVAALLVYIARASGEIAPEESAAMIEMLAGYFDIERAEALELITRAMSVLTDRPELTDDLVKLARAFSVGEQEAIALMSLKVIAADGQREFNEMEEFKLAMEALNVAPETVHRAFDKYFEETMPGL